MNRSPEFADALRREIAAAPHAELPAIFGLLAELQAATMARIVMPQAAEVVADNSDELLTVEQTAARLGVKPRWVREHAKDLPRVAMPGRVVRFSARRLEGWTKRRSYNP